MSDWKVSLERIELLTHPNAENLELARVGDRQYVVQKGLYRDGDWVINVPEKSLLPDNIADDFRPYLVGKDNNIVKSVKLRGELSEGVLLSLDTYKDFLPIAEALDIKYYSPPLPSPLAGFAQKQTLKFTRHSCGQLSTNADKTFVVGEAIVVTEKIHGSQINIAIQLTGTNVDLVEVSSKGLNGMGLCLKEDDRNFYWQAWRNSGLLDMVIARYYGLPYVTRVIQLIGEAVPCQKKFDYGFTKPDILLYRIVVDGQEVEYPAIPNEFKTKWVPTLLYSTYNPDDLAHIKQLANFNSSLASHIMEGVVVTAYERPSAHLKYISDAYAKRMTGEEFN